MLTEAGLIHLPFTPDLTEGSIAYASRSLAYTYDRMGGSTFDRLRRIVSGVAVELAFRRYLGELSVPFDVLGATPFTNPDQYDVSFGGNRCDIKSFMITRRAQISRIQETPALLLDAPALVPLDQINAEGHRAQDIYLFAFCPALTAASQAEATRAAAAGQPVHLIHPMPKEWARPLVWRKLERLALKSECDSPVVVEIGGQDNERNFITARIKLTPRQRLQVEEDFYSVAYLHAQKPPAARIGIYSLNTGEAYLVQPHQWGNIWVYGMEIILAGWLTYTEFRQKGDLVPIGSCVFQYDRTRVKNLAVKVGDLRPLAALFDKVKEWHAGKGNPR